MAAYAALTSLMQILDQLERHPFPPISLDRQQVDSLTEIVTSLQEFLEGYNSPFVDSDEADPLEMRIADAAYAAEDVIESYIVDNIRFAAAETHDDEVNSSSGDELNPEEETNSYEDVSSGRESICPGEEEINSHEEGGEASFSGDELNSEEEINSNEETASHDDEVTSSGGELNSEKDINSDDEDASSGDGEAINSGEEISCVDFYQDVWKVIEEMDLINKEVMEMMRKKTVVQGHHQLQRNIFRSSSFSGKNSSVMVGLDAVLLQLLHKLNGEPSSLEVIPITGMGGIGKTTLARNIFENALIKEHFDICAWVTISQQFNTKEILCKILYQDSGHKTWKSEEELGVELHKYLYGRRYLIIMDDIWSIDVWEKMKNFFADCKNGSRIIVTTRQSYLTSQLTDSNNGLEMEFLDEVNSWNLFSKTVFGEEGFLSELEIVGKKIVEKCRGLPLSIVVIGGLLAKSQHTHEHWEHIEHKLNSIVNSENDEYCLKILKLSYNHLPVYLKPSFLYMGTFEEDRKIHVSSLIRLWVSEGFLKPENGKSLETIGECFLKDLINRNLILVDELGSTGNIKYCKMHDLLRDLCLKEAEKDGFYYVIGQDSSQGMHKHNGRRMFYPKNSSNKAFKYVSHIRTFTSHHRVGLSPNFRLLRLLNACHGNFPMYKLQDVIHELVNSRYVHTVPITTNLKTKLHSSVNFLWNLHTLEFLCIFVQDILIIAPVEIWKMSQLRHVDVTLGFMHLPDPPSESSVILENLETLKGVVNFKCGEEVVKRIPNIKRLSINYKQLRDIGRHDGDDYCLSNLKCLRKLESFTMKVYLKNDCHDLLHNITFPHSLKKLTLDSVVGWEEMLEKIGGSLPLLQKLKLEYGRFTTHKWETVEGQFPSLKFLKLSYCGGLKQWMIEESSHFPCLEHLELTGLKELEEIPSEIGEILTLQLIELFYCSESAVKSAKKIVEEQEELQGDNTFCVRVWESRKKQEALQSLASPNFKFKLLRRSTSTHHPSWSSFFNCFRGYNKEAARFPESDGRYGFDQERGDGR
ncbi:hypothetical protein C2S51_026201 [Perilla frutescens var. frutescens]|nr:hypothetical protein C2S51_026201 [Perilla frutescens var. frutescens]